MPPKTNSKAAAGRERKAQQAAQKKAEDERRITAEQDREWQKGSKSTAKADEAAAKADEAAQKRREKQELLAAEEAGTSIKVKAKVISGKKKKKTDDLSLLQDALVSSAEKKTKAKKRQEEEKLLAEQRLQQEKLAKAAIPMDPLLQNTEQMLQVEAGRSVNKAIMEEGATSGLDAALQSLNVGGGATEAKSQKALYKEFEERMLPVVKEDYPGLRLTQYKEKVFGMWKKSPENPMNQVPQSTK